MILVRHGETAGQSSIRYYGATDVPLSDEGRDQVRAARDRIRGETFQSVWASTLCRSWESAKIVAPGHAIHLESNFREIDFGDWEGLTADEIAEVDPAGYARWQDEGLAFTFPGGEARDVLRARVARGLERIRASGAESVLVAVHKGVVRALLELITGFTLPPDQPELGGVVQASRRPDGTWYTGRVGSDASVSEIGIGVPMDATDAKKTD
ncbi:MAG: histidine phosphatase family protein [Myxococcota bacterium]